MIKPIGLQYLILRYKPFPLFIVALLSVILSSCTPPTPLEYTEIPFEMTGSGFSVPVVVNGDSLKFAFDTGANKSLLYQEKLDEEPVSMTNITNILGEQNSFPVINIDNLSLGSNKFLDQQLVCFKKLEGINYEGIIGTDIARNFRVKVDFLHQKMTFHPQPGSSDRGPVHVPVWMDNNLLYTVLNFGEVSDTFLIDTGCSGSLRLKEDLFTRIVSRDSSAEWLQDYSLTAVDRVAKDVLKRKYGLVDVKVGPRTFKHQLAETDTSVLQNLLGAAFFQQQSFVEFNYLDTTMIIGTFPPVIRTGKKQAEGSDQPIPFKESIHYLNMQWLGGLVQHINAIGVNFELTPDKYAVVSGLRQDNSLASGALDLGDTLVGYDTNLFEYQDLYSQEEVEARGYQILPVEAMDSIIVYERFTVKNNWTLHLKKNGQLLSVPITRKIIYKTSILHTYSHLPPEKYPLVFAVTFKERLGLQYTYMAKPNLLGSDTKMTVYSNGKEFTF